MTDPERRSYTARSPWLGIPRARITRDEPTDWSVTSIEEVFVLAGLIAAMPKIGAGPAAIWMLVMVVLGVRRSMRSNTNSTIIDADDGEPVARRPDSPAPQARYSNRR